MASLQVSEHDAEKLGFIEEMTRNADAEQEKVLAEILSQNAETEYLQRYRLAGASDRATFKAKIPVVSYEDLEPYIERIANGDRSPILSAHPISELLISSGTSAGKNKRIPTIKQDLNRRILLYSLLRPIINQYVLGNGKGLHFIILRPETRTSGGLLSRGVVTSVYKSTLNPHSSRIIPAAAVLCQDYFQSMYAQMLCGLCQRLEVHFVGTTFASGLLQSIHFLRQNWPQLVSDIITGNLSDRITDQSVRDSVSKLLKPDPELASFISQQCSYADWSGIIPKIWPNAKFIDTIVTGSMAQYIPMLEMYSGGLPIVSMLYGSSECFFGVNLNPMCHPLQVSYTILPNMAYFEFIPYEPENESGNTELIDLANLEEGKEYELVITTHAGLCRYQVGDILRVTGFYNAAPQFKFVRRKGMLLNINGERTDEAVLQKAMESASELLKPYRTTVAEYTSSTDIKDAPGHYIVYWELMLREGGKWPDGQVLESCCLAIEEALNQTYRGWRAANAIGPLEIRVVKCRTFEELMDRAIAKGASINQYKVPRCVASQPTLEMLESRVVSAHFSPACPRADWSA